MRELQARLEPHATEDRREWWTRYLRGEARFRGVAMAAVRKEVHGWHSSSGIGSQRPDRQAEVALALLREPFTEDKLAGMLYLGEILIPGGSPPWARLLPAFEGLFEEGHLADWNSVDWFCVKVLGPLVARDGEPCGRAVGRWRGAGTLWQRRASAVAFVKLVAKDEVFPGMRGVALRSCDALLDSPARFSQTGAAWVLRELGAVAPEPVKSLVERSLGRMSREAVRKAVARLPDADRQALLGPRRESSA